MKLHLVYFHYIYLHLISECSSILFIPTTLFSFTLGKSIASLCFFLCAFVSPLLVSWQTNGRNNKFNDIQTNNVLWKWRKVVRCVHGFVISVDCIANTYIVLQTFNLIKPKSPYKPIKFSTTKCKFSTNSRDKFYEAVNSSTYWILYVPCIFECLHVEKSRNRSNRWI